MEPNVQTPFEAPMQPSTAFTNDDLPDAPSSNTKDTVAIIAIIVVLAALLIGGAYAWKRSHNTGNNGTNATSTTQTTTPTSTTPITTTSTPVVVIPPPTTSTQTVVTPPVKAIEWLEQSYALGQHDVSFKIPKGYHVRSNYRDKLEIIPDATAGNQNPEAVMTVKLVTNLELAKVMDNEAMTAPTGDVEWHDVTLNNLSGKALKVENKAYAGVDVIYALKTGNDAFVLRQVEDGLWDPFADVVKSFKEIFVDRKG